MNLKLLMGAAAVAAMSVAIPASAEDTADPASSAGGDGPECELVIGGDRPTVGNMMQHLRDRDDSPDGGGTPKHVVDYYGEWDNVGGLIADKCDIGPS